MPPFLATILAGVLSSVAAENVNARIRAAWARPRFPGEPRAAARMAPQTAPPRVTLTPPVSYGPPVPGARPGSASAIASQLAARRS